MNILSRTDELIDSMGSLDPREAALAELVRRLAADLDSAGTEAKELPGLSREYRAAVSALVDIRSDEPDSMKDLMNPDE